VLRRWTGKPLVVYVTGRRRLTAGYRALLSADVVLVNAPTLKAFLPDAEVVPPVTDSRRWRPALRSAPPQPPVILFLGAFERCRGVEYLIRAMDHVPDATGATLRLAWNGVGRARHAAIVDAVRRSRSAGRIELLESADVARLYAEAAVVVIPRIAPERMAFPVRIVEAASMAVPLVVTRINGMDRLVEGCGLAVPPRDPAALGAALARLLTDRALYARLSAGCLEKARAWDSTRSLETFYAAAVRCR
jgi:glycosyltransferase involved in cell wall biosynthesis